jgi:hypothetical protein
MNVMNKIVIPRTKATIHYILLEMEEMAREELFRIKIIKKKKLRMAQKKKMVCPICKRLVDVVKEKNAMEGTKVKTPDKKPELLKTESILEKVLKSASSETKSDKVKVVESEPTSFELPEKEPLELIIKVPSVPKTEATEPPKVSSVHKEDTKLAYLKKLLIDIIALGKDAVQTGLNNIDIDEFVKDCEDANAKIDNFLITEKKVEGKLKDRLSNLKCLLSEVVGLAIDFKNTAKLAKVENVDDICDEDKKREKAASHIDDKEICILTPSIEAFLEDCELDLGKISSYAKAPLHFDQEKLKNLQGQVEKLEKVSANADFEGIATTDMEKLTTCCKDFKDKLEEYKRKVRATLSSSSIPDVRKLVKPNKRHKSLPDKTRKKENPISDNVPDYIDCCEDIKKLLEQKDVSEENPEDLNEICTNIDCVLNLLRELKEEGTISKGLEVFLKSFELEQGQSEVCNKCPLKISVLDPKQSKKSLTCDKKCKNEKSATDCGHCKSHKSFERPIIAPTVPPPCSICDETIPVPCKSCDENSEDEVIEQVCSHCSLSVEQGPEETPAQVEVVPEKSVETPVEGVDSTLGLFEKRVKRIVRVTRTLNEDGTIREETETTIITKCRHDPNMTSLNDDDESLEDLTEDNELTACVLQSTNVNQVGFLRKAKSEEHDNAAPMCDPILRECASSGENLHRNDNEPI